MHVHSSLSLSTFEFLSLNDAVCVCPKVPMCFIQVDGHREAQISAQFWLIQLNFSHFDIDWSVFGHICRFFHFT